MRKDQAGEYVALGWHMQKQLAYTYTQYQQKKIQIDKQRKKGQKEVSEN